MAPRSGGLKNRRMAEAKLSDGTVTLSSLRLDDAEAHLAGEDEQLVRWLSGGPGTREGVEAYLRHCQEQWDTTGPLRFRHPGGQGRGARRDDRPAVHGGGPLSPGQVNVAYGLYPSWRGHGLAARAVLLVSRYAASEGAKEAVIRVDPGNAASAAAARQAGFTPGGPAYGEDGTRLDRYIRDLRIAPP
jgi:RimJ/RimL family protein N-acetyltransferase